MKPPPRSSRAPAKNNIGTNPSPHPHSPSSSPQFPEFFKVYIPAFNSHQLRVPPDFSKHCKSIPRKAVLREPNGRSWKVGVIENARGLFIRSGWPEFVQDNALKYGDCLIFRYDMCSAFMVKIFGRNGCQKERRDFESAAVLKMEMEEEEEEETDSRTNAVGFDRGRKCRGRLKSNFRFARRSRHAKASTLSLDCRSGGCANRIKLKRVPILGNEKGESWTVALGTKADGRLFLSSGWPKFRRDNGLQLNQQCVREFVADNRNNKCGELHFSFFPELRPCESEAQPLLRTPTNKHFR